MHPVDHFRRKLENQGYLALETCLIADGMVSWKVEALDLDDEWIIAIGPTQLDAWLRAFQYTCGQLKRQAA